MCGRYTARRAGEILKAFNLAVSSGLLFSPRFNAAPSQQLPVLTAEGARLMTWGFQIPGRIQINARAETAATLGAFKMSYAARRCVIPADGFFEWTKEKQPYFFALKKGQPFGLAGLWQHDSFLILTTKANSLVEPIHGRMPCMVEPGEAVRWIEKADADLLKAFDADRMTTWPVSKRVNRATVDDPSLVEAGAEGRAFRLNRVGGAWRGVVQLSYENKHTQRPGQIGFGGMEAHAQIRV